MLSAAGLFQPGIVQPGPMYILWYDGDQMFAWPASGSATCVSYAAGGSHVCCQSRLRPVRVCSEEKR